LYSLKVHDDNTWNEKANDLAKRGMKRDSNSRGCCIGEGGCVGGGEGSNDSGGGGSAAAAAAAAAAMAAAMAVSMPVVVQIHIWIKKKKRVIEG
jgi:hypothetical protein